MVSWVGIMPGLNAQIIDVSTLTYLQILSSYKVLSLVLLPSICGSGVFVLVLLRQR